MDKILVVLFAGEREAYEGYSALKELDDEGTITLYGESVIAKSADGKAEVKKSAGMGPLGTVVGMVTGALVGMVAGPAGVAVGATAGMAGGSVYDLAEAGIGVDFLDGVAERLEPGMAAVVAEVQEEWVTPVDTRMEQVGGIVFRRVRGEIVDAQIERDLEAIAPELAAMEAEYEQENEEAKARLRAKIAAAKADLKATQERARARVDTTQREADAKTDSLKQQAAKANGEAKQRIEKRRAEVEAKRNELSEKLNRTWQRAKETLRS